MYLKNVTLRVEMMKGNQFLTLWVTREVIGESDDCKMRRKLLKEGEQVVAVLRFANRAWIRPDSRQENRSLIEYGVVWQTWKLIMLA